MRSQLFVRRRRVSEAVMLTPAQLLAARAMVGWSREDLATASGTSRAAIQNFETMGSDSKQGTVAKWRRALEAVGVVFIDSGAQSLTGGPGVRLKT